MECKKIGCEYCDCGEYGEDLPEKKLGKIPFSLLGEDLDIEVSIDGNKLFVASYGVSLDTSPNICELNYCPMCGRKLEE